MVRRRGPPAQSWKTFLRNHAPDIAAIDLFVVRQARSRIGAAGSRISAWVLPIDEERMIARYTSQAVDT